MNLHLGHGHFKATQVSYCMLKLVPLNPINHQLFLDKSYIELLSDMFVW